LIFRPSGHVQTGFHRPPGPHGEGPGAHAGGPIPAGRDGRGTQAVSHDEQKTFEGRAARRAAATPRPTSTYGRIRRGPSAAERAVPGALQRRATENPSTIDSPCASRPPRPQVRAGLSWRVAGWSTPLPRVPGHAASRREGCTDIRGGTGVGARRRKGARAEKKLSLAEIQFGRDGYGGRTPVFSTSVWVVLVTIIALGAAAISLPANRPRGPGSPRRREAERTPVDQGPWQAPPKTRDHRLCRLGGQRASGITGWAVLGNPLDLPRPTRGSAYRGAGGGRQPSGVGHFQTRDHWPRRDTRALLRAQPNGLAVGIGPCPSATMAAHNHGSRVPAGRHTFNPGRGPRGTADYAACRRTLGSAPRAGGKPQAVLRKGGGCGPKPERQNIPNFISATSRSQGYGGRLRGSENKAGFVEGMGFTGRWKASGRAGNTTWAGPRRAGAKRRAEAGAAKGRLWGRATPAAPGAGSGTGGVSGRAVSQIGVRQRVEGGKSGVHAPDGAPSKRTDRKVGGRSGPRNPRGSAGQRTTQASRGGPGPNPATRVGGAAPRGGARGRRFVGPQGGGRGFLSGRHQGTGTAVGRKAQRKKSPKHPQRARGRAATHSGPSRFNPPRCNRRNSRRCRSAAPGAAPPSETVRRRIPAQADWPDLQTGATREPKAVCSRWRVDEDKHAPFAAG